MSTVARWERKKYMGVCSRECREMSPRMTPLPSRVKAYNREKSPNRSTFIIGLSGNPRRRNSVTEVWLAPIFLGTRQGSVLTASEGRGTHLPW